MKNEKTIWYISPHTSYHRRVVNRAGRIALLKRYRFNLDRKLTKRIADTANIVYSEPPDSDFITVEQP